MCSIGVISLVRRSPAPTTTRKSIIDAAPLWSQYEVTVTNLLPLLVNVLLSNMPQLLTTLASVVQMNLLTYSARNYDLSTFSWKAQYLCTSAPLGNQSSPYFFGIPRRSALIFMTLHVVGSWALSQGSYLQEFYSVDVLGNVDPDRSIHAWAIHVYWFSFGVSAATSCMFSTGITIMLFGCLSSGIPPMGSCSKAISAACHPDPRETNIELTELMYGVIPGGDHGDGRRHVEFSSKDVEPRVEGVAYY